MKRSHGNNLHDVIIAHMISADAQRNRHGNLCARPLVKTTYLPRSHFSNTQWHKNACAHL